MPRGGMQWRWGMPGSWMHNWASKSRSGRMSQRRMVFVQMKRPREGSVGMLMSSWGRDWQAMVMPSVWGHLCGKWVPVMLCWGERTSRRMHQRRRGDLAGRWNHYVMWMVAFLPRFFPLCWRGWWYSCAAWSATSSSSFGVFFSFPSERFVIAVVQDGLHIVSQVRRYSLGVTSEYQRWKNWTGLDARIGGGWIWPENQPMATQTLAVEENKGLQSI